MLASPLIGGVNFLPPRIGVSDATDDEAGGADWARTVTPTKAAASVAPTSARNITSSKGIDELDAGNKKLYRSAPRFVDHISPFQSSGSGLAERKTSRCHLPPPHGSITSAATTSTRISEKTRPSGSPSR